MRRAHTLADERARMRKRKQIMAWFGDLLTERDIAIRSGRNKYYVGARCDSKRPIPAALDKQNEKSRNDDT